MPGTAREEHALAAAFEAQRERLVAMAHRMLGSHADAQDAVQEAWLRLARQDATIDNLAGWLTTVVSRICLDMLRSRNVRPEGPYDRLPELLVTEDDGVEPEDDTLLAESVGLALLMVLDTLRPTERLAFVLHDTFTVPFHEIGQVIGRSTDATKMLVSRARRKVQTAPSPTGDRQQQRAVVDAFLTAARDGDFEGLLRLLHPDVTWHTHSTRGVAVKLGATAVAAQVQRGARFPVTVRPVLVNGAPGMIAWGGSGRPLAVMACTVHDGRIVQVIHVRGPDLLASVNLPGPRSRGG